MYQSLFGQQSVFNDTLYKRKLIAWLKANKITEFVYSNAATIDGIPVIIRLHGLLSGDNLTIIVNTITKDTRYPNFTIGQDFIAETAALKHLTQKDHFLVYRLAGPWQECSHLNSGSFVTRFVEGLIWQQRYVNDDEYQQLYSEFLKCKTGNNLQEQRRKFDDFCKKINQQLSNKFYHDVDMAAYVRLVDETGKTVLEKPLKSDHRKKQNDINLHIKLYTDGRIEIKHEISSNYLKQYEQRWIDEAKKRGLEVNISEMRKDIISFLQSEEAELSFREEFLRSVKSWYDNSVASYVEGIQATQKITRSIWETGAINESTWHSSLDEHGEWPKYMQFNPAVAGVTDGVVDEIASIPLAAKSVYQLATEEEKRKAFAKIFTTEGFGQMLQGLKTEAVETVKDNEKRGHFGGKTLVSVISMLSGGGIINKAGKLDELMEGSEEALKRVDDIPEPGKVMDILDEVKKAERTVVNEKALKEFVEEVGEEFIEESAEELKDITIKKGKKLSFDELKAFWNRGNDFNSKAKELNWYRYHELWLEHPTKVYPRGHKFEGKPRRYRLDSYDPSDKGKIVSRKATTLEEIQQSTFEKYCLEVTEKYPVGSKIARKEDGLGEVLKGEYYLELPDFNKNFIKMDEYIKLAKEKYGVEIIFKPE